MTTAADRSLILRLDGSLITLNDGFILQKHPCFQDSLLSDFRQTFPLGTSGYAFLVLCLFVAQYLEYRGKLEVGFMNLTNGTCGVGINDVPSSIIIRFPFGGWQLTSTGRWRLPTRRGGL